MNKIQKIHCSMFKNIIAPFCLWEGEGYPHLLRVFLLNPLPPEFFFS